MYECYSLNKDRVFRQGTPMCFKYASKQNKYKSSLYKTLFVINHLRHVLAIICIFRLNTKSYRKYILQCHEYYGQDLLHQMEVLESVPLTTEPGISLLILTPMKILQRNLNSTCYDVVTFLTQ
jgi:hypothetical protein